MEKEYFIDDNDNDITLEVIVSTRGIVSTDVSRKLNNSAFVSIAKSVEPPNANGKGMISQRSIGHAALLAGAELDLFTLIRLDLVPPDEWETLFNLLMVRCILRGGSDGMQVLELDAEDKEKTASGRTMSAKIRIKLTLKS